MEYCLSDLAERMQGTILQGNPSSKFSTFNIDSRLSLPREMFFAIKARRDGHDYIPHAVQNGAAGAVISRRIHPPDGSVALIQVDDTLTALQRLAKNILTASHASVIGITGSAGKTTTKEFTSQILSRKFGILKSEGNFNNHLGLPLSLLRLNGSHQMAVLEYGMSALGEIAALTKIAPPDVAVITNIRPVHLKFFQNIHEIARAKQELLMGMNPEGTAVLNGDDALIRDISEGRRGRKIVFGLSTKNLIHAQNLENRGWDGFRFDLVCDRYSLPMTLPFFNTAYLYNFLAAAAVAWSFDIEIEEIAESAAGLRPAAGRGEVLNLPGSIRLIDDSYNSNPDALENALKGLAHLSGNRKIAILGDMLELGPEEAEYHHQAGETVANLRLDMLITVGKLALHIAEGALKSGMPSNRIHSFLNSEEAASDIQSIVQSNDIILIKGSRGNKMECITERIKGKG